ncbi:MAG: hypothetical protein HZC17_01680, partial [Candidatus Omnitrophica bacterium]|nr:hypothetical protein [Candidatus Omnitrophota bacterium]
MTLDTIAPEIKFSSVTLTNKPDYTLTYTSDGAQKTQAVTLVEGENTLEVVERDLAGNETKTNLKVTLDTIAPEVIFSSPTLTNKPDYTLAYTSDGVSISKNVTLVEGDNVLDVVERDLAGNETKTLLKVTLDTIAPEIKFSSVTLTNNPDYTLIYTTDGQRVTKPVTLVEGDNVLDVTERDLAGNETKTNLKVTLDTIPPQLEVTSSPLSRIANFDLTFTKDGAAVTKPVTLVEGGNVIPIVEQDAAGNETKIDTSIYYAQDLPNFLDQAIQTPQIAKPLKIDINTPGLLSVSIADGSKILYENGAIHHIELADGSFVQNVTLDLDGKIQNAELFLVNGLIQVAQNGSLAYQFTPAGVLQQFDTSGRVIRESQNGEVREFVYSGDHIWSVIKTEIGRYDAAGKLKVLITPSGYELKDIPDSLTVTNADGAQINVVGGLVSKVTKDGQDKNFSYTESGGVITRTQVSENGVTSAYSANGKLTTVQTADGTYTIENEKIKTLELKDGSKILDIDLDDQGNILKATILDLDGAYRTFENGLLVRMISPNGDIWIYANGKPEKLTTRLNLEYQFTYEPNQIKADLINVDIAKADTPIELVYDPNFKLEWMKKKNDILFKYEPAGVFVYDPANPDTETILDDAGNIDKVFIHASITNPVETEIRYRYGKPREIYENGVLTQKYSYEYLSDGTEIVIIESVAKNLIERYQDGVLQSSFDPITEVLTTFAYGTGGKKTLAVKSRQGQEIERYEYTYLADKTVARDKSGKISEFDPVTEKILREIVTDEKGNISTFEYTHTKNDFLPNENPFELSALSSQPSAKSFDIAGYPNADFFAHDGLYLYYRDKTSGEIHRLGPDFDYVDASGQVKPLDTVITANVPIPQSPFKDKEDEFKQMYPDAKFVFADGSFVFIIKDSEVLVYRQKEGDMVRGWTIQSPANFEQVFYDWIHNEIWIKKENENVFRRLGGLRDLDGHETSRRELSEIVTTDGTKVRYHDGKVEEITKPDGLRVRNLVTDEAGNVVFAKYFNTDGSTEEIQGHTSIEIPQPDFSKKIYTRGKLEKWILVDGREIVYTYEATAAAEKTFAKLGDWTYEYDEKGQLLAVSYQPSAKSKKEYAAIQEPGGRVIISNRDAVCDDCPAEKITFGAGRQIEEYENLRTDAEVYFKNG